MHTTASTKPNGPHCVRVVEPGSDPRCYNFTRLVHASTFARGIYRAGFRGNAVQVFEGTTDTLGDADPVLVLC